jgi:hypothetical protein
MLLLEVEIKHSFALTQTFEHENSIKGTNSTVLSACKGD